MAYQQLPLVIVDSPAGYQTFNTLAENAAAVREALLVEHGSVESPGSPQVPNFARLGRHDIHEIARTVGKTYLYTTSSSGGVGAALKWTGVGIPFVIRFAAGQYILPVIGLSNFWGKASPIATASDTVIDPQVRPFTPSATNGNSQGLWVTTYQHNGTAFVAADQEFTFALYGDP